jgi:hypothetical protein
LFESIVSARDGRLRKRVKRLHPYRLTIEAEVIALFDGYWTCLDNYACHSTGKTEFSEIKFLDGCNVD